MQSIVERDKSCSICYVCRAHRLVYVVDNTVKNNDTNHVFCPRHKKCDGKNIAYNVEILYVDKYIRTQTLCSEDDIATNAIGAVECDGK